MRKISIALALIIVPVVPLAQEVEIAAAIAFTEGPTADQDGNVYFVDRPSERIMMLSPEGVLSTYREPSNATNGLVIDSQNRLIACEGAPWVRNWLEVTGTPRITRTDLETGETEILINSYMGMPLTGPNDVTIDGRGRIYFTEPRAGAVYRVDEPGQIERILGPEDIQRPNGIQISPDDSILYLVETNRQEGGARMIRAYDLQSDGTVRNMRIHYDFYPGRSADCMSIDTEGNLYAAAGLNRLRGSSETLDTKPGVHVIAPDGELLRIIPIPEDTITNTAFGGPDMRTLYVTAGKTLYSTRTEIPGLPR